MEVAYFCVGVAVGFIVAAVAFWWLERGAGDGS